MVMKPRYPIKYKCNLCGWHKIYSPQSDCLIPGIDCPEDLKCPDCGNEELISSEYAPALLRVLKKIMG